MYFNIMHPCMHSLSNWSPSSRYPRRNPSCVSPLSHYVTCPAQITVLNFTLMIMFGVSTNQEAIKHTIFSSIPLLPPFTSTYSLQHPVLQDTQSLFLLKCNVWRYTVWHLYKQENLTVLYCWVPSVLGSRKQNKAKSNLLLKSALNYFF